MVRHIGNRNDRIGAERPSSSAASSGAPGGAQTALGADAPEVVAVKYGPATLSVLRTTLRRLAYVGLQVFDVWAENAENDDLEWANDNVKPPLEMLLRGVTK